MNLDALLSGVGDCPCGRPHETPTRYVKIGEGAISSLSELSSGYDKILLVADKNTFSAAGLPTVTALSDREVTVYIFNTPTVLVPNEEAISKIEGAIPEGCQLIVGVGSGVINDLCKYVSHIHSLPYFIVATAPSMDGYTSRGSALILEGMKITKDATPPLAVIADTRVLADAPYEMLLSGFGDIVGKLSCLNDWRLSSLLFGEYLCEYVLSKTEEAVREVISLSEGIKERDPAAVCALMEALVAVGILMSFVGNSRPASGSEHHLSHYFEIVGLLRGEEYLPHGLDVVYSSVITARLRERLASLEREELTRKSQGSPSGCPEQLRSVYGKISEGVIGLQERLGWYSEDRLPLYAERWCEVVELLKSAPTEAEMLALLDSVGLDFESFTRLYGEEKISEAILFAKDLKDRYTVLWLNYDISRS